eukprot:7150573-Prymnesium_polylepis.2
MTPAFQGRPAPFAGGAWQFLELTAEQALLSPQETSRSELSLGIEARGRWHMCSERSSGTLWEESVACRECPGAARRAEIRGSVPDEQDGLGTVNSGKDVRLA